MSEVTGRSLRVRAFGDTADEIELSALDEARRVFGDDAKLTIRRDYLINRVGPDGTLAPFADGKSYTASVDVREQPQ